jgi:hypothetical protein
MTKDSAAIGNKTPNSSLLVCMMVSQETTTLDVLRALDNEEHVDLLSNENAFKDHKISENLQMSHFQRLILI